MSCFLSNTRMSTCGGGHRKQCILTGMDDFKTLPLGATDLEQSLPPDWRDARYRQLGLHLQFVADVIEAAFGKDWVGSLRLADLQLEPALTIGAGHKKGFNDIACSTILLPEWQDEAPEPMRIYVVIEVQWTAQRSMPFRVMQYEAMRYQHLQKGPGPVPRIQTIVLYIGESQWGLDWDAGELIYDGVLAESRLRVPYTLVDLQRLEAKPGTKNLLLLLAGIVRGTTLESLTAAADALAGRLAELGDVTLERDVFELVLAQGKDSWSELDWSRCKSLAELVQLLKEGEMTWPEKWKAQMRAEMEAKERTKIASKVEPEVRTEVASKVEPEVRTEVAARVEPEVRTEVEARVEPEVRTAVEARVEPEVRTAVEARVRPEIVARLEAELRPKIEEQLRERIRAGRRVR